MLGGSIIVREFNKVTSCHIILTGTKIDIR